MEKAINSRQKAMLVIAAMVSGFGLYASDYPIYLPFLYWIALAMSGLAAPPLRRETPVF
jgi:hypothetical protein